MNFSLKPWHRNSCLESRLLLGADLGQIPRWALEAEKRLSGDQALCHHAQPALLPPLPVSVFPGGSEIDLGGLEFTLYFLLLKTLH